MQPPESWPSSVPLDSLGLAAPAVAIAPATISLQPARPADDGDHRWLFAVDRERDAKIKARAARATAAPRPREAGFEALPIEEIEDVAPPPAPAPAPFSFTMAPASFSVPGGDFADI